MLSGGSPGPHRIQGIGAGFVPEILDRTLLTEVRRVSEEEAEATRLELARREGLLVGISAGAAVRVALDVARTLGPGKTVVTVLPDTGERYIATPPARAAGEPIAVSSRQNGAEMRTSPVWPSDSTWKFMNVAFASSATIGTDLVSHQWCNRRADADASLTCVASGDNVRSRET